MGKAADLLSKIEAAIASGRTVTFTTYTQAIAVSPKTAKAWKAAGRDLFRIEGDHLCLASGRKFLSVMGCKITVS